MTSTGKINGLEDPTVAVSNIGKEIFRLQRRKNFRIVPFHQGFRLFHMERKIFPPEGIHAAAPRLPVCRRRKTAEKRLLPEQFRQTLLRHEIPQPHGLPSLNCLKTVVKQEPEPKQLLSALP